MNSPLISEQLQLKLFPGVPWDGRSPRALTRAGSGFILKPEAHRHEVFFADPDQYDLFCKTGHKDGGAPPIYGGAPLLLPF